MKVTRRVKITVTQHRVVGSAVAPVRAFCPVCEHAVETLVCARANEVLGTDGLASLIAAGRVHTIALVSGGWRICRESLFVQDLPNCSSFAE
ncbi:MAG: hypothetical protein ABI882_02005 [Acidobacteriota bacterium]